MYVETLRYLPPEAMQIIRKLENVKRKIIKCKWSLVFNNTCIKERLIDEWSRLSEIVVETESVSTFRSRLDSQWNRSGYGFFYHYLPFDAWAEFE